jgi:glycine cleavage system transcriptional repressor
MAQLIITAVGPDRPGIVGELTAHLHAAGGNILDSRMVNLRGEFAMMILLELPTDDAVAKLTTELPGHGDRIGLRLSFTVQLFRSARPTDGIPYRLKTYSMDQPGIVHRVTHLLQGHGVNIEELETRQESAAFAGGPLFLMEMRLTVPSGVAVRKLRGELEALCDSLNCDVDLEPA